MGPVRWGIGKLVCDTAGAPSPPVVLPFHHRGTDRVLPTKTYLPRAGERARIVVGSPVDLADLQAECRRCKDGAARRELWGKITARIEEKLLALERDNRPDVPAAAVQAAA